jgi:hypothetical protein
MKYLKIILFCLIFTSNISHADCSSAVSGKIKNSGYLSESDRTRLMDDCKKYQDYRLKAKDNPKGTYVLNPGDFTCRKREDYVEAYNRVLERGGKYNPDSMGRFKSCRVIETPTLVAVRTQKDPSSPLVEILYHSQYSVYFLHEGWVHGSVLIPYGDLLNRRVK